MTVISPAGTAFDTGPRWTPRLLEMAHEQVRRASGVDLPLRRWDGVDLGPRDAGYRLVLCHPWSLRRTLLPPSDLTAGEAYVEGDIDIEGDMVAVLGAAQRIATAMGPGRKVALAALLGAMPAPPRRRHHRRAELNGELHSRERDRAAVAFHYDLPAAFYEQFLDEHLVYSCAYVGATDEPLEVAQERKLEVVCRKLRLRPGMRLLDVGCGFGSLVEHAARHHGVEAVGVTLSETQAEVGRGRIEALGLAGKVELRLQDYRDVTGTFDAVASIGMVEHVGPSNYPEYFATLRRLAAPGALVLNHGIVVGDPSDADHETTDTFVGSYVFPDGGVGPAWRVVAETEKAGLELLDVEQLRPHYAWTLRRWIARLERNHDAAVAVAGEQDYRIWRTYMAGSALSFEEGSLGIVQVLGRAPGGDALPWGREWRLPTM